MSKLINIAVVGLGQVGSYLLNELNTKKKDIEIKTGQKIKVVAISAKNINKKRKFKINKKMYPEKCYIEINSEDALEKKIEDGDVVMITSARNAVPATAFITDTVTQGQCFMPMHYEETNYLTNQIVDPYSRQPNYKGCVINYRILDKNS